MANLGDYVTKHHAPAHHIKIRPIYVHMPNSPRFVPSAPTPSVLQGCVDSTLCWQTRATPSSP
eukprot:13934245-Ditylum_brightwellii.AAC.1